MVPFVLDLAYLIALVIATPWLLYRRVRFGKQPGGIAQKLLGLAPRRLSSRPCLWLHAVSVGEVLLLRRLVSLLTARRPELEVFVSTTTATGMELARKHFAAHRVFYFPFDFSWAVARALLRVRPDVVALAELELWPNFITSARHSGARVAVLNGRMSPHSHRGYRRLRFLMRHLLSQVQVVATQTNEYAERFVEIGAFPETVTVTGSLKYDGLETDRNNSATSELRRLLRLEPGQTVWVAGSTSEPEEQIVLDAYGKLLARHPELRLVLVPRHKERFDLVAALIAQRGLDVLRRSTIGPAERGDIALVDAPAVTGLPPLAREGARRVGAEQSHRSPVILIDTLGELSAVWGLADIAFVGGSFAPRGGQNMIEPAAYGAAVLFGPGVWNFQDTVDQLLRCGGAVQLSAPGELAVAIGRLIEDPPRRRELGASAQHFVAGQHGATQRTVELLEQLLGLDARSLRQAA